MIPTDKSQREGIKRRLWEWAAAAAECEWRRTEIIDLQRQMQEMDNVLRGQRLDDMPKGTNAGNPVAAALEARERDAMRIAQLLEEINVIKLGKERMDAVIRQLPERLREILRLRYIEGLQPTKQIPRKMHIVTSTVYEWLDEAYEKIAEYERSETFGRNL